jgi:hypothetical protein
MSTSLPVLAETPVLLPQADDILLSRQETARYLRVTVPTLDRWARMGVGPKQIRICNVIRYRLSTLRAFSRTAIAA